MADVAPEQWAIGSAEWPGLSKLTEEAGEVLQVVGKLLANGGQSNHWDGSDLRARLIEELGDLAAAAEFVVAHNFDAKEKASFGRRQAEKRALFEDWHDDQCAGSSETASPVPVEPEVPCWCVKTGDGYLPAGWIYASDAHIENGAYDEVQRTDGEITPCLRCEECNPAAPSHPTGEEQDDVRQADISD